MVQTLSKQLPALLGGEPVRRQPFNQRKLIQASQKDAVMRVLDSGHLSGFLGAAGPFFNGGAEVQSFEGLCRELFDYKHVISVNSWTTGLQACVGAVGIEPGDEIICSPFSMSASASCVLFYGGIPVFADVDPTTGCLDPISVKENITPRTKAILPVHLFGQSSDMQALGELADAHGLSIIEDAAQSPLARYQGRPVGGLRDIGGFSLNYHKHIHTGEGGLIVTNDDELAERCRYIRNHGENAYEAYPYANKQGLFGSNYRLTELQAALGSALLPQLPGIIEKRNQNAQKLDGLLAGLPAISPQKQDLPGNLHSYYAYPMRYDSASAGLSRNLFVKAVNAELPEPQGWETIPLVGGYSKPLYWSELYQKRLGIGKQGFPFNLGESLDERYQVGRCPVVEKLYAQEQLFTFLVTEANGTDAMRDFYHACEKVLAHTQRLQEAFPEDNTNSDVQLSSDVVGKLGKHG